LSHRNSRSGPFHKTIFLSAACFLGSMFSKEMGVTLPLVTVLILMTEEAKCRSSLKEAVLLLVPYFIALGIYGAFRVSAVGPKLPSMSEVQASFLDWGSLVVWALGQYIRYSVVPYPLYVYHVV